VIEAAPVTEKAVAETVAPTAKRERPSRASRADPASASFRSLLSSARRDFDSGDASAAQRKALDAIALDPTRGYAYVLLGAARDALGNSTGAAAAYRQCLRQAQDGQRAACAALSR
jgi:Flp pilus assembly protein TadD